MTKTISGFFVNLTGFYPVDTNDPDSLIQAGEIMKALRSQDGQSREEIAGAIDMLIDVKTSHKPVQRYTPKAFQQPSEAEPELQPDNPTTQDPPSDDGFNPLAAG